MTLTRPGKEPRAPLPKKAVKFVDFKKKYNLPDWMHGQSHLRWKEPIEKGVSWEVIRKIINAEEKDCYTCFRKDLIANGLKADCGHCYPVSQVGSNNKLSWDRRLIHLQCSYCNGAGQGEQGIFEERIKNEYGESFLLEARQRRFKSDPIRDWKTFLEELWTVYNGLKKKESVIS